MLLLHKPQSTDPSSSSIHATNPTTSLTIEAEPAPRTDLEKQQPCCLSPTDTDCGTDNTTDQNAEETSSSTSAIKGLGWLDRFLALWILLAMVLGILLGNFVPETGEALERGQFVGVAVPIGKFVSLLPPLDDAIFPDREVEQCC